MAKFTDPFEAIVRVDGHVRIDKGDDTEYPIDPAVHYYDPSTREFNLPPLPSTYSPSRPMGRAALMPHDPRVSQIDAEVSHASSKNAA